MQKNSLSLLCCCVLSPLAAQTARVLPAGYDTMWAGNNGTGTGYATQNGISQNLFIAPFNVGTSVQGVGFRRTATTADFVSVRIDFEMTLSSTTADLTTLSATFANNLGGDAAVVFPRQIVNVPARAANSSPADFFTLPTAAWVFNGPNFLVQCKSYGTGSVNIWRMDRFFERATVGEAITWGTACSTATVSSTSTAPSYMPGSSITFTLAGAAPSQPAFAFLGFDATRLSGTIPLPVDLGLIGATGCTLLVDTLVTLPNATDAAGAASFLLPLPGAGVSGAGFGVQWLYVDPNASNPALVLSTRARLVRVGPLVAPNRYVWDLSNVNAATGSLQAGGPIAQIVTVP
jgi:hypothetical protein